VILGLRSLRSLTRGCYLSPLRGWLTATSNRALWRQHAYHLLDTMPAESYVVSINGAEHNSFTDNPLLAANTVSAYRNRARILQVIRDYTRAFFSRYLMNENTGLLEATSREYPEVTVDRFGARVTLTTKGAK
jgi:hypothetical protein